jgi:hypothetical protein
MPSMSIDLDAFIDRGNQITDSITREGRIAAKFLPKYSLSPSAKNVTVDKFSLVTGLFDDVTTVPLAQISVTFTLDWQQLSDENFETSLYLVRKAAQGYCALEDRLLFRGQAANAAAPQLPYTRVLPAPTPPIPGGEIEGGRENDGLIDTNEMALFPGTLPEVFDDISNAQASLEMRGAAGPWAVAMGTNVFDIANTIPNGAGAGLKADRERIEDLLDTRVLRVSILPPNTAFLMSGAVNGSLSNLGAVAGPADRAVAVEPELRYLDRTNTRGKYQFAVVGCLALRIRDGAGMARIDF